jgi:hypothetical protein
MRLRKIAILAVQDAWITDNDIEGLEEENPRIKFLNNGEFLNKMGTCFVINTNLIKTSKEGMVILHKIIIPNRAAQIGITWGEDQEINLLNDYAPNDVKEKVEFFREL